MSEYYIIYMYLVYYICQSTTCIYHILTVLYMSEYYIKYLLYISEYYIIIHTVYMSECDIIHLLYYTYVRVLYDILTVFPREGILIDKTVLWR